MASKPTSPNLDDLEMAYIIIAGLYDLDYTPVNILALLHGIQEKKEGKTKQESSGELPKTLNKKVTNLEDFSPGSEDFSPESIASNLRDIRKKSPGYEKHLPIKRKINAFLILLSDLVDRTPEIVTILLQKNSEFDKIKRNLNVLIDEGVIKPSKNLNDFMDDLEDIMPEDEDIDDQIEKDEEDEKNKDFEVQIGEAKFLADKSPEQKSAIIAAMRKEESFLADKSPKQKSDIIAAMKILNPYNRDLLEFGAYVCLAERNKLKAEKPKETKESKTREKKQEITSPSSKNEAPKTLSPMLNNQKTPSPVLNKPKTSTPTLNTPKISSPMLKSSSPPPKTPVPKTAAAEPPKKEAPKIQGPQTPIPKTPAPKMPVPKTPTPKTPAPKTATPTGIQTASGIQAALSSLTLYGTKNVNHIQLSIQFWLIAIEN